MQNKINEIMFLMIFLNRKFSGHHNIFCNFFLLLINMKCKRTFIIKGFQFSENIYLKFQRILTNEKRVVDNTISLNCRNSVHFHSCHILFSNVQHVNWRMCVNRDEFPTLRHQSIAKSSIRSESVTEIFYLYKKKSQKWMTQIPTNNEQNL